MQEQRCLHLAIGQCTEASPTIRNVNSRRREVFRCSIESADLSHVYRKVLYLIGSLFFQSTRENTGHLSPRGDYTQGTMAKDTLLDTWLTALDLL